MPVQVHAYEHPVKSTARSFVRQIFLFWLTAACVLLAIGLGGEDANHRDIAGPLIGAPLVGALFAVPLWSLYRLARFAIGR